MFRESLKLKGHIKAEVRDSEGNLREERDIFNVITNAGLDEVTALIGNVGSPTSFGYLAVGTGTTAAAATDTTLETEITDSGLERGATTNTQQTTTVTNDTLRLAITFSVTGTKAVTEVGAFNAASVGTMLGRQVFSALNVASGDTLTVQYSFIFA
jgi:hypothetical protein|tara:strand:+ start:4678 stop:5145 length:468 start_codon:yes stop_codon:yes gene_type:complete